LRHECFHVFRDLRCGEFFEEEFQVGLGLDLTGRMAFSLCESVTIFWTSCPSDLGSNPGIEVLRLEDDRHAVMDMNDG
jgi:hypothetical protein